MRDLKKARGHPTFKQGKQKYITIMLKRWAFQALSPVTLTITQILSIFKSRAKVLLIIDIYKEKGIYLCKNPFFLQYKFFPKFRSTLVNAPNTDRTTSFIDVLA